ncbi:anthranilate synthase component I [Haloarchaeobius amylolyticus]|uniref:anthranilate synthase component I n=1 Tax=Haloarchaeobius amylolyticus TaxID=1198296 RepID=UPI00226FA8FC|nr:anthranilate synthase component I [Haloarchaeobius amylolyticus]
MSDEAESSATEPTLAPDRETFVQLVEDATEPDRPAVVRVEATLDLDETTTPLGAYAALSGATDSDHAFLLESAEKTASSDPAGAFSAGTDADRHARYSFVGYDPAAVVTVGPEGASVEVCDDRYKGLVDPVEGDTLDTLRSAMPDATPVGFPETGRQHLDGGLVGFLCYDAVYDLFLDEVGVDRPDSRFPDAEFVLATKTLVFDHHADELSLVFTPVVRDGEDAGAVYDVLVGEAARVEALLSDAADPEPGGFVRESETAGSQEDYEDAVARTKEHVLDGDIYQGVISRTRELVGDCDPMGLYAALREVNPSPYMYLLQHGDFHVVGASPETLVSVSGQRVVSNPIAGTCPRGDSPVEDRRLAGEMLADEKERAEHTMLVDLARNDVRRVSEPGSVRVEEFMNVLKYSHVQHIESTVTGTMAAEYDAFDATRAAFPAGTLTGAPKIRAMEIIDDLEDEPRGLYGGGVGYYSWTGDADVAIVIRTATVEKGAVAGGSDRVTVRAGAGIVADSDPTSEYEETEKKMDGVLEALRRVEQQAAAPSQEVSR